MIATSGAVPRVERRRSWWEKCLKQQKSEGGDAAGTNRRPLKSRNKSSGVKHGKKMKTIPKDAPLVSRQGFRSTLSSTTGVSSKPQPLKAQETDSSSESDEDFGEHDVPAAASRADKGVNPTDKKPTKEKKRYILFIGNLPYTANAESVLEYFKKHGTPAKEVRMLSDKATQKPRGCCFVEFETSRTQQSALKLHHTTFEGRRINIEVTCGGGGNTEARREKIKKRNLKIAELRQKRKTPITI